jgi:hypothetical protein
MLDAREVESLVSQANSLQREAVIERLLSFRGSFPVDFTPQYLAGLSLERLRHILMAVCLQSGRRARRAVA